jgi:hypothetical protein
VSPAAVPSGEVARNHLQHGAAEPPAGEARGHPPQSASASPAAVPTGGVVFIRTGCGRGSPCSPWAFRWWIAGSPPIQPDGGGCALLALRNIFRWVLDPRSSIFAWVDGWLTHSRTHGVVLLEADGVRPCPGLPLVPD